MQEKSKKIVLIAMLAVAIIAGVFAVFFATQVPDKKNMSIMEYEQTMNGITWLFNIASCILYIILIVAVVAILFFAILQLIKNFKDNPKAAYKTIAIIVLLGVVFLVAWLIARGGVVPAKLMKLYPNPVDPLKPSKEAIRVSNLVGAACISVYILFFASLLSIVYVEVAKLIKK